MDVNLVYKDKGTPLHWCAIGDQSLVAEILIRAGADASVQANDGSTVLHAAAKEGAINTAILLLEDGAVNVHTEDASGCDCLHVAVKHNQVGMVSLLMRAGCEVTSMGSGKTSLHALCELHDYNHILDAIVAVSKELKTELEWDITDNHGKAPIHLAVEARNLVLTQDLLKLSQGNILTSDGSNPLHCLALDIPAEDESKLAQRHRNGVLTSVLQAGANPNLPNDDGLTPLALATVVDNVWFVRAILSANPPILFPAEGGSKAGMAPIQSKVGGANSPDQGSKLQFPDLLPRDRRIPLTLDAVPSALLEESSRRVLINISCPISGLTATHFAAKHGRVEILKALWDAGADFSALGYVGESPLQIACLQDSPAASTLIRLYPHPTLLTEANDQGDVPLSLAAASGNIQAVSALLQHEVPIENDDMSALYAACSNKHSSIALMLLKEGADPLWQHPESGATAVMAACSAPCYKCVKVVLDSVNAVQKKKLVTGRDRQDQTGLMLAAASGCPEVARVLITAGARVDQAHPVTGRTPLHQAAASASGKMVKTLLTSGMDPNLMLTRDGDTPLHVAVKACQVANLTRLAALPKKSDAELNPETCNLILDKTDMSDRPERETVVELLRAGANPSVSNRVGWTPLHIAAGGAHHEIAGMLMASGAAVMVQDKEGWSPLHEAAFRGSLKVLDMYLKKAPHARPNMRTFDMQTPLHVAAVENQLCAIYRLLDANASVNSMDKNGFTPLGKAIVFGHPYAAIALKNGGGVPFLREDRTMSDSLKTALTEASKILDRCTRPGVNKRSLLSEFEAAAHSARKLAFRRHPTFRGAAQAVIFGLRIRGNVRNTAETSAAAAEREEKPELSMEALKAENESLKAQLTEMTALKRNHDLLLEQIALFKGSGALIEAERRQIAILATGTPSHHLDNAVPESPTGSIKSFESESSNPSPPKAAAEGVIEVRRPVRRSFSASSGMTAARSVIGGARRASAFSRRTVLTGSPKLIVREGPSMTPTPPETSPSLSVRRGASPVPRPPVEMSSTAFTPVGPETNDTGSGMSSVKEETVGSYPRRGPEMDTGKERTSSLMRELGTAERAYLASNASLSLGRRGSMISSASSGSTSTTGKLLSRFRSMIRRSSVTSVVGGLAGRTGVRQAPRQPGSSPDLSSGSLPGVQDGPLVSTLAGTRSMKNLRGATADQNVAEARIASVMCQRRRELVLGAGNEWPKWMDRQSDELVFADYPGMSLDLFSGSTPRCDSGRAVLGSLARVQTIVTTVVDEVCDPGGKWAATAKALGTSERRKAAYRAQAIAVVEAFGSVHGSELAIGQLIKTNMVIAQESGCDLSRRWRLLEDIQRALKDMMKVGGVIENARDISNSLDKALKALAEGNESGVAGSGVLVDEDTVAELVATGDERRLTECLSRLADGALDRIGRLGRSKQWVEQGGAGSMLSEGIAKELQDGREWKTCRDLVLMSQSIVKQLAGGTEGFQGGGSGWKKVRSGMLRAVSETGARLAGSDLIAEVELALRHNGSTDMSSVSKWAAGTLASLKQIGEQLEAVSGRMDQMEVDAAAGRGSEEMSGGRSTPCIRDSAEGLSEALSRALVSMDAWLVNEARAITQSELRDARRRLHDLSERASSDVTLKQEQRAQAVFRARESALSVDVRDLERRLHWLEQVESGSAEWDPQRLRVRSRVRPLV